jgi:hypothetical protein
MAVVEKDNEIYHDEHDCTVKITNDNTKHQKAVTVTLRVDLLKDGGRTLNEVVDQVNEAFNRANTGD